MRPVRPSPVNVDGTARPVQDDRRQIVQLQREQASNNQVLPGDPVASARTDRQQYRLGEGEYKSPAPAPTVRADIIGNGASTVITPNQAVTAPYTYYQGVRFAGNLTLGANAVLCLQGCEVTGTITVPATGVLILQGCTLAAAITVATGGHVHAIGTLFAGVSAILNTAVAANCYVIGCHKTSVVAHTFTTIVAETI